MWTMCNSHGRGAAPKDGDRYASRSQNGRRLYATRSDALVALRAAYKAEAEKNLAAIDALIERKEIR